MKKNSLKTLCATNHSESIRHADDYYATDPKAVRLLCEKEKFEGEIWECACGEGEISKELELLGYTVVSSDLIDRNFGYKFDFLSTKNKLKSPFNILTNPPYSLAVQFIEKALEITDVGRKIAMLLPVCYLEGKRRKEIYEREPPRTIYVCSSILQCAQNGDFSALKYKSAQGYAWYVWEKGFEGDTVVKWID